MYKYVMTPANDIDADDMLNNLEDCVAALSALASFFEMSFRDGNIEKEDSHGVFLLIKQQAENIEVLTDTLRWKIRDIRYSRVELTDVHKVAEMVGVSWPKVATIVTLATGLYYGDQDKPSAETQNEAWVKEAVQ